MIRRELVTGGELTRQGIDVDSLPAPGETINTRGEIVATDREKMDIVMIRNVRGEGGKAMEAGSRQTVGFAFGRELIQQKRATAAPPKKKNAKKSAPEGE